LAINCQNQERGLSVNCQRVFANPHLHLVVWNRFSPVHDEGMRLAARLMGEPEFQSAAMVLLRPLGRTRGDYGSYDGTFHESGGDDILSMMGDETRGCCELWVQVTGDREAAVWGRLKAWVADPAHSPARAWRTHCAPLWQPMSHGLTDCQYAEARSQHAALWLSKLGIEYTAWFLKVIWHRASVAILNECVSQQSVMRVKLWCEQARIADILGRALSPFELEEFGIPGPPGLVDPSAFAASHLAAFALNAVTQECLILDRARQEVVNAIWQVEQFWRDTSNVTWPHKHRDLCAYLRAIRSAAFA